MSEKSALETNINSLKTYADTNKEITSDMLKEIAKLIQEYDNIQDVDDENSIPQGKIGELIQKVSTFMNRNNIPIAYDGGRRRKSASSSSRPRRRSSKKRGTQRKQKRRQRRGSRRAY